jgi:glycosyltransferase involved in cell wall biosynthesis
MSHLAHAASATVPTGHDPARAETAAPPIGVTVVVPLLNEQECVPKLIPSLRSLEARFASLFDFEFILVDDGSTDDTVTLLRELIVDAANYRILRHKSNRGIAAAIHTGIRAARHEIVASMDCDGSYDPSLLVDMVARLRPGVDLVTATPYHAAGGVDAVPLWRLRLSRLASTLYAAACGRKLSCYTSCFRVYRRAAAAPLELENEGFVGVAELLWKILDRGGQVAEQPARLRARVAGASKMRVMRAGVGHLRLMARIAWRRATRREPNCVPPRRRPMSVNDHQEFHFVQRSTPVDN